MCATRLLVFPRLDLGLAVVFTIFCCFTRVVQLNFVLRCALVGVHRMASDCLCLERRLDSAVAIKSIGEKTKRLYGASDGSLEIVRT